MIKEYSLHLLEKAFNEALHLDPLWHEKIEKLNGHVIQLIIQPLQVHFFLCIENNTFLFRKSHEGPIDTTIQSSPLGFIRLSLLPASKVRSLFNDQIKITGDVLLGQEIKALFDSIQLDWEGYLAHFTGDIIAHQIGNLFRRGHAFSKRQQHSFSESLTEYLHEELHWFPTEEEISDFCNDVDTLFLEAERLEAHIRHIEHDVHEKN